MPEDEPLQLYEHIGSLRKQLAAGQAERERQLKGENLNLPDLTRFALQQQRLSVLLLEMLRQLLTSEPELKEIFEEKIFGITLVETLHQTRITFSQD